MYTVDWKATAFSAVTGKHVYTRINVAPKPKDREAYVFLTSGSSDTAFMRDKGISIISSNTGHDECRCSEAHHDAYHDEDLSFLRHCITSLLSLPNETA